MGYEPGMEGGAMNQGRTGAGEQGWTGGGDGVLKASQCVSFIVDRDTSPVYSPCIH